VLAAPRSRRSVAQPAASKTPAASSSAASAGNRSVGRRNQDRYGIPAPTPRHLAEKILTSRSAFEGERKQVTVLFADVSYFEAHAQLALAGGLLATDGVVPVRRSTPPSNVPSVWSRGSRAARCRRGSWRRAGGWLRRSVRQRLPTGRCGKRSNSTEPSARRDTPSGLRRNSSWRPLDEMRQKSYRATQYSLGKG
jgi:hypothetical protein